jgi:hypothetical protein
VTGRGEESALTFLAAVVAQAALPLGLRVPEPELAGRESRVASLALAVLDPADAAAAERLRGEPVLLAAFFQNIDLLYRHGYPRADAVAMLVMRALEGFEDEPGGGAGEAGGARQDAPF